MSDDQPVIVVVAIGRNEGDQLKRCLRSASTHVPVHLLRLRLRGGFAKGGRMLLGKIVETAGILRFVAAKVRSRSQGAIFYK